MKKTAILLLTVFVSVSLGAQDLKPVKDKASKLFGYQDKSKNWVIPPSFEKAKRFNDGAAVVESGGRLGLIDAAGAWILKPEFDDIDKFDKNGLCEVMVKSGKEKLRGVANREGRLVIPVECQAVSISKSENMIMAKRYAEVPGFSSESLWGVYDADGREIFPPQFYSAPSFYRGTAEVKSASSKLLGIASRDGEFILPCSALAIDSNAGGYDVLSADFVSSTYDSRMIKTREFAYPGYVAPYEPGDDNIRLAAWHVGCIGRRIHSNQLRSIHISRDYRNYTGSCSYLNIAWNGVRFVRFEPVQTDPSTPGAIPYPTGGRFYTIRAVLCEPDGTPVEEISPYGWFEGECEEGIVYNAGGTQTWIIMKDINTPSVPAFSTPLTGYRNIDSGDIHSALGIHSYDADRYRSLSNAADRRLEIIEEENAGITSYLPRPAPDIRALKTIDAAMRAPIFRQEFHIGEVLSCKVSNAPDNVIKLHLGDRLVCRFEDRFEEPRYKLDECEEEIWWGPDNARFAALTLETVPHSAPGTEDDVLQSGQSFILVLALYEQDGTYLRTLAESPAVDIAAEGLIVFEKAGIALVNRQIFKEPEISLGTAARQPAKLSAVQNLSFGSRGRNQAGGRGHNMPGGHGRR